MGSTPVSGKDTIIYYPSDWLIEGGPTFEQMGCPEVEIKDDTQLPLTIIYNAKTGWFGIMQQNFVMMESRDRLDIAGYVKDYVEGLQTWITENGGSLDGIDNIANAKNAHGGSETGAITSTGE